MQSRVLMSVLTLASMTWACSSEDPATGAEPGGVAAPSGGVNVPVEAPTFIGHVAPILKQGCSFQSCHGGGSGGFNIPDAGPTIVYASLVGQASRALTDMPLVDPGHPENSFLLAKVEGTQGTLDARCIGGDCGGAMPEGSGLLPPESRQILRDWIAAGAPFGAESGTTPPAPEALTPLDLRVAMPVPDNTFIDFVTGETVIPPGEERMICTHVRFDGTEDAAFAYAESKQGQYGHHALLFGAKEPKPPGTVEDCTDAEDMARFNAYTIGDQELPEGYAVHLPAGYPMVVQSHHINANERPILVRDVIRLKRIALDKVQTWASVHITNGYGLQVPAQEQAQLEFDCIVEKDVDLLMVGGHMHEWGTRFELLYGPDTEHLDSLYLASPWVPQYRDLPPITLFFNNPMQLKAGHILRTKCAWNNDQDHELIFPSEMCSSFGFVGGTKEPVLCGVN